MSSFAVSSFVGNPLEITHIMLKGTRIRNLHKISTLSNLHYNFSSSQCEVQIRKRLDQIKNGFAVKPVQYDTSFAQNWA